MRDNQSIMLRLKLLQQIYDLAEGNGIGQRNIAITTVCSFNRLQAIILTALFLAFKKIKPKRKIFK